VVPGLLGGLYVLAVLCTAILLAPLLRQGGLAAGVAMFGPAALAQFRRVRAILALRAQEIRLQDQRALILLLRSFADDDFEVQRTIALSSSDAVRPKTTIEEQIVAQLWEAGPVVAIGQPGLNTDPIGAAREHIVGPLWQPRVQTLIEESALVVVVLGKTEGLLWEYEQLARHRVPVLAIWPAGNASDLLNRWERFTAIYPPVGNYPGFLGPNGPEGAFSIRSALPGLLYYTPI
jgi:hypothetical protein